MQILNILPGILFGLVGLYAIYFLIRSMFGSFFKDMKLLKVKNPFGNLKERQLVKKAKLLASAKEMLEEGRYPECANLVEDSFFLEPPLISIKFLDKAYDHNFQVLAFLLYVNKNSPTKLTVLPELERLIQERSSLHRSLAESYLSLEEVKKKRKAEGKKTPEWALNEFESKIDSIEDSLVKNKKEALDVISLLSKAIVSSKAVSNDVTYH